MLKKTRTTFTALSIFLMCFIVGCAKAPESSLSLAKNAVSKAEADGAYKYAKDKFVSAQSALEEAISTIQNENKKLPIFRNYDRAEELIKKAQSYATESSNSAILTKERILAEQKKAELDKAKKEDVKSKRLKPKV